MTRTVRNSEDGLSLAFVLTRSAKLPSPEALVRTARAYGLTLKPESGSDVMGFSDESGGQFLVAHMPAPHPDAPKMPVGPMSPSEEEVRAASSHLLLTAFGMSGTLRERDVRMAGFTAAVVETVDAVAAMLGHGVLFYKAGVFAQFAAHGAKYGSLVELAVDITAARESETRMSFLTHGMARYGREELYVTCPIRGRSALDFVMSMSRWLLTDMSKQLPTGDTVGRSAEEKILVQRVPSPTGAGPMVIRLDLQS